MSEVNQTKASLWTRILAFLKKIFGLTSLPVEVTSVDNHLTEWWAIYRHEPTWIKMEFVTADGKKRSRTRLQLGMGKISCAEMAGLVLSEEPDVNAGDLVKSVIEKELLWDNLRRSTEYQGALGAQVLKVGIGSGDDGKPEITLDFVKASNFIPLSWDNSGVSEGSFLDRRMIGGEPYVRIETHKRARGEDGTLTKGYEITNRVYSEKTEKEAPLSLFGDGVKDREVIDIDIPLFAYIRNPEANNIDPEAPTGISLFANAIDTIKAIDVAFDQFFSDIELGGRRIALPGAVFRKYQEFDPENGAIKSVSYFDPSDRVFMRLEGDDAEKFEPKDLTYDIRAEQFKQAIQILLDLFAFQTGFDPGYFAFDGTSVKTATEVISENSHTYKTLQGFRANLDKGLKHIFTVINILGTTYKIQGAATKEPSIEWDDSVIEDRNSRSTYYSSLYSSGLIDLESALSKVHRLPEKDAKAMAEKILNEKKEVTAGAIFGVGA
jgi:A118 family predicted phage portal protein